MFTFVFGERTSEYMAVPIILPASSESAEGDEIQLSNGMMRYIAIRIAEHLSCIIIVCCGGLACSGKKAT